MKLTKQQLKQLIKEELQNVLDEQLIDPCAHKKGCEGVREDGKPKCIYDDSKGCVPNTY